MNFYKTHDESAADLKEKVTLLNINKKGQDVQAVLKAFLTYHGKNAEPWMYEALALAIKMNKGTDKDFKTAMGFAADLAERSQNPNHLVSVAGVLLVHKEFDRVGELLDQAYQKIPHRAEPLVMMIDLAQQTKDPQRMASAIESLFSLGWPAMDETLRRNARAEAEKLAKTLQEEQRSGEANELIGRVTQAEARDVFVRLTWEGDAGLALIVEEPLGATARGTLPRTVFGGAILREGFGSHPESLYVCPRGFDGDYVISVETIYNNPEKPAREAKLELITHEGTDQEVSEIKTISLKESNAKVVLHLKGGNRKKVLPFLAPTPLPARDERARGAKEETKAQVKSKGGKAEKEMEAPTIQGTGAGNKPSLRPGR